MKQLIFSGLNVDMLHILSYLHLFFRTLKKSLLIVIIRELLAKHYKATLMISSIIGLKIIEYWQKLKMKKLSLLLLKWGIEKVYIIGINIIV